MMFCVGHFTFFCRPCRVSAHLDGSSPLWQLPRERGGQRPVPSLLGDGRLGCQDGRVRPRNLAHQQGFDREPDEESGFGEQTI